MNVLTKVNKESRINVREYPAMADSWVQVRRKIGNRGTVKIHGINMGKAVAYCKAGSESETVGKDITFIELANANIHNANEYKYYLFFMGTDGYPVPMLDCTEGEAKARTEARGLTHNSAKWAEMKGIYESMR